MTNPTSRSAACDECRAQIASLNEADLSSPAKSAAQLSPESAAHLESCASCQIEYSMLRNVVGEMRALPFYEAPPNLRTRVRAQIEREGFAAKNARRAPFFKVPLFKVPRWTTFSLSGAFVTACLLVLVARQPSNFPTSNSEYANSDGAMSAQKSKPLGSTAKNGAAGATKNAANSTVAAPAPSISERQKTSPNDTSSTGNADSSASGDAMEQRPNDSPAILSPAMRETAPQLDTPRTNAASTKVPSVNAMRTSEADANEARGGGSRTTESKRFAKLEILPESASRAENSRVAKTATNNATNLGLAQSQTAQSQTAQSQTAQSQTAQSDAARGGSAQDSARSRAAATANRDAKAPSNPIVVSPSTPSGDAATTMMAPSTVPNQAAPISPAASAPDSASNESASGSSVSSKNSNGNNSHSAGAMNDNSAQSTAKASRNAPLSDVPLSGSLYRSQQNNAARADDANAHAFESNSASSQNATATAKSKTTSNSESKTSSTRNDGEVAARARINKNGTPRHAKDAASNVFRPNVFSMHKSPSPALPSKRNAEKQNGSFESPRARLTFVPREDAQRARLTLQWLPISAPSIVVWRGTAQKDRPIVAVFDLARSWQNSLGNKNRRAEVSFQVLQSMNARHSWKTVDSTILNSVDNR